MKSCVSVIASIVLGVAAFVVPVHAEILNGTFEGTGTLTPTGTPGIFTQNFTGDGIDDLLGAFTIVGQSTIDFSDPPHILVSDGTVTETFADLTLFGTTSGTGLGNGQGFATFTIDFLITGGSGDGVGGETGEATLTGTITQTSPTTESIAGTYTGTVGVAIPEPSTWMLFATGLFAVCGLRRSRSAH